MNERVTEDIKNGLYSLDLDDSDWAEKACKLLLMRDLQGVHSELLDTLIAKEQNNG